LCVVDDWFLTAAREYRRERVHATARAEAYSNSRDFLFDGKDMDRKAAGN
jgi:hypothetical protein